MTGLFLCAEWRKIALSAAGNGRASGIHEKSPPVGGPM